MSYPRGSAYDERVAKLASSGMAMHGEADLVEAFLPRRVLDAGCGTGRVAVELARRGMEVVGVDSDADMLQAARAKPEAVEWLHGDLSNHEVLGGRVFDLAVMAGNVMVFVKAGTEADVVTTLAGALGPGGVLVAGFCLVPGRIGLDDYDRACRDAGLELTARWSSWERAEFSAGSDYAVSVHRRRPELQGPDLAMHIAIASDHAGFDLKSGLIRYLKDKGHQVDDHGTHSPEMVDYPPYCAAAARAVATGHVDVAIVVGGSGQGEAIAANKVHGARAALCPDTYTAVLARAHNNANVLSLGARFVAEPLAREILDTFLSTAFDGGRHQRRLDLVARIEADECLRR